MADGWVQVYPTLVIRGTGLYELWKKGLYHNYEPTLLIDLVARILALVPPWVRVYRIQVMLTTPISIITAEFNKLVLFRKSCKLQHTQVACHLNAMVLCCCSPVCHLSHV